MVNFFEYVAQEVRELLAELGFRSLDEAVGRVDALDVERAVDHWKAAGLDLSPILHLPDLPEGAALHQTTGQDHGLDKALDNELVKLAAPALERGEPVRAQLEIRNVNRTVGTILGHEVTKRYRGEGLPDGTIDLTFTGSAGQSFGAFVPQGHHPAPGGRRQRLPRQGALRRPDRRPPGPVGDVRRRGADHRRQRDRATAPRAARSSCAVSWASGSASATPACPPSWRASATTAAST